LLEAVSGPLCQCKFNVCAIFPRVVADSAEEAMVPWRITARLPRRTRPAHMALIFAGTSMCNFLQRTEHHAWCQESIPKSSSPSRRRQDHRHRHRIVIIFIVAESPSPIVIVSRHCHLIIITIVSRQSSLSLSSPSSVVIVITIVSGCRLFVCH
jgi:hypothetical protein